MISPSMLLRCDFNIVYMYEFSDLLLRSLTMKAEQKFASL